jgi:uracil-DNA glycosylase
MTSMNYVCVDSRNYSHEPWGTKYKNKQIKLRELVKNPRWNNFFDQEEKKPYFKKIELMLAEMVEKKMSIFPYPELVFYIMNVLSPEDIKVILIGQDPYPGTHIINGKKIPDAMGMSFSAPAGAPLPRSLNNIYKNLVEFGHWSHMENSGSLVGWLAQGCFFMNSAWTVFESKPNSHKELWDEFSGNLIKYFSKNLSGIVYVMWGREALNRKIHIDAKKNRFVISSHPSPFSVDNNLGSYLPFSKVDHFGEINKHLRELSKEEIIW